MNNTDQLFVSGVLLKSAGYRELLRSGILSSKAISRLARAGGLAAKDTAALTPDALKVPKFLGDICETEGNPTTSTGVRRLSGITNSHLLLSLLVKNLQGAKIPEGTAAAAHSLWDDGAALR